MQVNDLIVTGDARVLGNLYANGGNVSGGGGGDGSGVTYSLSKSGSTITLRGSDGSTSSVNDDNTTYSLSSLGAAAASHTHPKSQITDFPSSMPASDVYSWAKASSKPSYSYSEVGAAPSSHSHIELINGTVGLKASDSNEISFKSNANYIYFGYDNRMGSSGVVTNYKFGTHSGASNASSGIIECGSVIEGGTALSSKYAPYSHSHSYAASSHTHDDRYYTESEINTKLNAITKYAYQDNTVTTSSTTWTTVSVPSGTIVAVFINMKGSDDWAHDILYLADAWRAFYCYTRLSGANESWPMMFQKVSNNSFQMARYSGSATMTCKVRTLYIP